MTMIIRNLDARITSLAAPTCGVIHATTLRHERISRKCVANRIADGRMVRALERTYFVGPSAHEPSYEMRLMAGTLHAGPGAMISHGTALVRAGVWDSERDDGTIHVTSPRVRCPTDQYQFHQSTRPLLHQPLLEIPGAPTMDVIDALLSAASSHTPHQLASMIDRAVYRRCLTVDALRSLTARSTVVGISNLRQALRLIELGSVGTRSRTEDELLDALERAGLAPDLVNVRGALGLPADEPDFVWQSARLNVEVDGGHHDAPRQRADDERRDSAANDLGWRVERFTARRVWRELEAVVHSVRSALEARGFQPRRALLTTFS